MSVPEAELVCPACAGEPAPVYPPRCSRCEWAGDVAELVTSGRSRARQFVRARYPETVRFSPLI